jgi:ABC-2 type transport system ATP-binding protein
VKNENTRTLESWNPRTLLVNMINIENLTKIFGQHEAVKSISFSVDKGETLGLLGPNGAGKTTTMRMITGYLPPTEGRVMINDMDMFDHPLEVKKQIGYLPEQPPLYLDMTVMEYLEFAAQIRRVRTHNIKNNINRVAELCGIADKLGRLTGNLSKGYRQRVGLAQALVHDPKILILDEPTSGLDPRQIIEIRDLIKELGREKTVILSSHILQEVTSVCEKVAIINEGKLVAFDTIDNLSHDLGKGQRIKVHVAKMDRVIFDELKSLPYVKIVKKVSDEKFEIEVESGHDIRETVSTALAKMGAGLLEMKTESMSLEDIFLKAVTGE